MFIVLTLIILVAAFNIITGLIMLVKDKGRDIAVLRTMGATKGMIMRIFFLDGAFIGVVGTFLGVVLGLLFCDNIENIRQFLQSVAGRDLFAAEIYFLSQLPAKVEVSVVATVAGISPAAFVPCNTIPGVPGGKNGSCGGICAMNNETGNNINARNNCVLELSGIVKNYKQGKQTLEVLAGIDLAIRPREVTALVGQSGSGKSTLLQIAGLLDKPTAGRIFINGQNIGKASDDLRTQLRRDYIGFVYQYHNLLGDFSALENVMLPMLIAGRPKAEAAERLPFCWKSCTFLTA